MKRSFFFLKDSVTGQFYTGQCEYRAEFAGAAVFYTEANAKKKVKTHINGWERTQNGLEYWLDRARKGQCEKEWAEEQKTDVLARKNLPNWGIKVVSVSVKAP